MVFERNDVVDTNLNEWINGGRSYRFEVFFHIEMQFVASTAECIAL